jgi:hypothetical protein
LARSCVRMSAPWGEAGLSCLTQSGFGAILVSGCGAEVAMEMLSATHAGEGD